MPINIFRKRPPIEKLARALQSFIKNVPMADLTNANGIIIMLDTPGQFYKINISFTGIKGINK
jgi:hypothetical protein